MRILQLTTRADVMGGSHVHMLGLIADLRRRGHDVHAAAGEGEALRERLAAMQTPFHALPSLVHPIRPAQDRRALGEVKALIRELRPDIVACHSSKAGVLGRLAARSVGVPSVFTAHGWSFTTGHSLPRRLIALATEVVAAKASPRVIAVSEYDKQLAIRFRLPRAQDYVCIHNGVADSPNRAAPEKDDVTFVMVARFDEQKDQAGLIEAWSKLSEESRLLLIGDGPSLSEAKDLVSRLGVSARVDFAGRLSNVAERLAACSAFVLWSRWEGFPLSTLEAMRAGLPVIVSDVGGSAEAVLPGQNGWAVPYGDLAALTGRLRELCANHRLRAELGAASRRLYEERYSEERMVDRTLQYYEDTIRQFKR